MALKKADLVVVVTKGEDVLAGMARRKVKKRRKGRREKDGKI